MKGGTPYTTTPRTTPPTIPRTTPHDHPHRGPPYHARLLLTAGLTLPLTLTLTFTPTLASRRAVEARDAELAFLLYATLKQLTDDAVKTPAALPLRRRHALAAGV